MASLEKRERKGITTWRVVWRQHDDRGERFKQQRTFTDAAEAERFRKLVEGSGNRWPAGWEPPTLKPAQALTFGEWADKAIRQRTRANERTRHDYRRDLERHAGMLFDLPLAAIDREMATDWLEDRMSLVDEADRRVLSDKTIRNLHGLLSSLFVDAMRQHPPLVTHNPFGARLGELAAIQTEEMVFLTPSEFYTVHSLVRAEYQDLIRLLFGTGLRFGEATALTVRDVELLAKRKTLTVTKAWKRVGSAQWVVGEPKTKRSRRTISLGAELVDMLAGLTAGKRNDDLLFPGAGGGRLPHIEVYKRGWAPAVARSKVCDEHYAPQRDGRGNPPLMPAPCDCAAVLDKTPRLHDLRHSHVAALITEGVRLEVISRRLGHSSIKITMDRYGHLDPALDDEVNAATDRVLARR